MSRNRNLRNKIAFPTHTTTIDEDTYKYKNSNDKCEIYSTTCIPRPSKNVSKTYINILSNLCNNTDDTSKSLISDTDNVSFISSTLSWEEEYEQEYTQKVSNELHVMERVLQGTEPIPSNYDEDEYKLWIEIFSKANASGKNKSSLRKTEKNVQTQTKANNTDSKILNKVIISKDKKKYNDVIPYFGDVLRISPIPIGETHKNNLRKTNKNYKINSFKNKRKIPRDFSPEYRSLPEIRVDNFVSNYSHNTSLSAKTRFLVNEDNKSTKNKNGKKNETILLPPLNNNNSTCSSSREFRSFSITPRHLRNGTSAISEILSTRRYENVNNNLDKQNTNSLKSSEYLTLKHIF